MSLVLQSQWQEWAREWGLTHRLQRGWFDRNQRLVGERKGLLIRVGWGTRDRPGLMVCIRFPRAGDPDRLRQALIADDTLDGLPGRGAGRRKMVLEGTVPKVVWFGRPAEFVIGERSLVWRRAFPWSAPKAAQLAAWVDLLITAISRVTPVFDGRCESCGTGVVRQYVMVDDLPMMMCASCVQRLKSEGEIADRTYDSTEARHAAGAARALLAAMAGAVVWAAIGALTNRVFAAAAIGIGAFVAWAYQSGAGRVDRAGRTIAASLTLLSVVAGETLLIAWWVSRSHPDVGFDPEIGWRIYVKTWAQDPGAQVVPILFGLVGAWVASRALQRPKLRARIEDASASGAEERRAA